MAIGSKKETGAMNKEYSWQNKPEEKQPSNSTSLSRSPTLVKPLNQQPFMLAKRPSAYALAGADQRNVMRENLERRANDGSSRIA